MNVALLGPTGSGKGTLIHSLVEPFGLHPIALGDVLRHKASHGTALGLLTREFVQNGELVPDEYVDAMIEECFRHLPPGTGTVLDGFPRTAAQARFLDDLLADLGQRLDVAVYINLPEHVIYERVARRQPPRHDDEPHILRHRLHVFRRMVGPVLKYYYETGRLVLLHGDAPMHEVQLTLNQVLTQVASARHPVFSENDFNCLEKILKPRITPPTTPDPALNLVLLGGPGSGKGTQAEQICRTFHLPHISTGDLFRDNIKHQTDLGQLAKSYMDRGELVPDDVTERMVASRLSHPDASLGFVLDGFPRTVSQAEALDEILHAINRKVTGVIHLRVTDSEIENRLSGRRICRQCQAPFHVLFRKPRREGLCNHCGGTLYQRDDDLPETIRVRLKNYHRQTLPLIEYYRDAGVLTEVKGEGDPGEIRAAMLAAVRLFSEEPERATEV
ncbi:MAG: adenylate kinase [Limisphaerales bacterium]